MNPEGKPTGRGLQKFVHSPVGRVLLPLALLVIFYVAIFSRYGIFGRRARPTLTPAEAQQLEDKSKALLGKQKYQEALEPTLGLYQAYPENHIYIGRLADIYNHLGRYADEAQMWEKYVDRAPTPVEACPQYGQAHWKQGDGHEKQAIAAFQRCLSFDPKNTDSIFYLAHALEMNGEWDRAAQQYEQGLTISPQYTDLLLGLARCRVRQDRHDEAKQIAEKVLAKSPDKADAMLILGMVYLHQDKYGEARKVLEQGAKLADSDPDFHLLLARAASGQNDRAEELRQYNRLVQLKPNDPEIRAKRDSLAAEK
ncbi:MAG TPA: tetratricopeptide repeat protein [Terriglobales bacterium]|nr:tetratricopeptide repeat protein [Terriglobales bacterium]